MNRLFVITIIFSLLILTAEGIYYLKFVRPTNNKKTAEIIAVTAYPTPTFTSKKRKPSEGIEFVSGGSFKGTNKDKPVPHRVGSLKGKIIKVEPNGLTVNIDNEKKFYLFDSGVYLFLRQNSETNIGYSDIKSGQEVEFNVSEDRQKIQRIYFLIIEN